MKNPLPQHVHVKIGWRLGHACNSAQAVQVGKDQSLCTRQRRLYNPEQERTREWQVGAGTAIAPDVLSTALGVRHSLSSNLSDHKGQAEGLSIVHDDHGQSRCGGLQFSNLYAPVVLIVSRCSHSLGSLIRVTSATRFFVQVWEEREAYRGFEQRVPSS